MRSRYFLGFVVCTALAFMTSLSAQDTSGAKTGKSKSPEELSGAKTKAAKQKPAASVQKGKSVDQKKKVDPGKAKTSAALKQAPVKSKAAAKPADKSAKPSAGAPAAASAKASEPPKSIVTGQPAAKPASSPPKQETSKLSPGQADELPQETRPQGYAGGQQEQASAHSKSAVDNQLHPKAPSAAAKGPDAGSREGSQPGVLGYLGGIGFFLSIFSVWLTQKRYRQTTEIIKEINRSVNNEKARTMLSDQPKTQKIPKTKKPA
ncbi:MAG: hypothetical protein HQK54_18225 [Oligoflexales bacterium]|nr:hypothetical protein [Oligoflexales bacterium]